MNARDNLKFVVGRILEGLNPPNPPSVLRTRGVKNKDPFTTREEWEKLLEKRIGKQFKEQYAELLKLLGDPPNPNNVPEAYWLNGGKQLRGVFEETLTAIALERATEYLVVAPIGGVDWMLVNERAVTWARRYAFDLVRDIEKTTRDAISKEIMRIYQDGTLTIDDIAANLEQYYSSVRASMIAVTETTRAAVQGEREIVTEIEKYGIRMQAIFQTANDDVVCEICGPLNGQPVEESDFPPLHPNCRCGLSHEIINADN